MTTIAANLNQNSTLVSTTLSTVRLTRHVGEARAIAIGPSECSCRILPALARCETRLPC